MPSTATLTHNDWLLGKIPDEDLDTTSTQINVTFPYWKKHLKDQLVNYKLPKEMLRVDHLPLDEKGKFLRPS